VIAWTCAAALWVSAAAALAYGDPVGALVLGLAALPATVIAALAAGRRAASFVTAVLLLSAWASASGVVPQVFPWDDVEHALLAFGCCWVVGDALRTVPAPRRLVVLAALGATMTFAVVWEIVEWSADQLLDTNLSPSAADTIGDLAAGLIGSAIAALALLSTADDAPRR
jgi:hypothetical protein